MTARSTYESTVATASLPRVATNTANAIAHQETLNANSSSGLGTSKARGVTAAQDATIRAANVTYQVAKQAATMAEQATIQVAKDLLRSTGDTGPA